MCIISIIVFALSVPAGGLRKGEGCIHCTLRQISLTSSITFPCIEIEVNIEAETWGAFDGGGVDSKADQHCSIHRKPAHETRTYLCSCVKLCVRMCVLVWLFISLYYVCMRAFRGIICTRRGLADRAYAPITAYGYSLMPTHTLHARTPHYLDCTRGERPALQKHYFAAHATCGYTRTRHSCRGARADNRLPTQSTQATQQ